MEPEENGCGDDPGIGDVELVRRARLGDREAFGALYERHARRVAARIVATGPAGGAEAVEDLLQEAFFRAWRSLESLREPDAFAPWVEAIAANLARDRLGAQRAPGPPGGPRAQGEADPARIVEVADAIASLPEQMRSVLELRLGLGLGYAEIGARLGITEDNVAVRLHRARARLRELLGEG